MPCDYVSFDVRVRCFHFSLFLVGAVEAEGEREVERRREDRAGRGGSGAGSRRLDQLRHARRSQPLSQGKSGRFQGHHGRLPQGAGQLLSADCGATTGSAHPVRERLKEGQVFGGHQRFLLGVLYVPYTALMPFLGRDVSR
jgi:hypothetical protein